MATFIMNSTLKSFPESKRGHRVQTGDHQVPVIVVNGATSSANCIAPQHLRSDLWGPGTGDQQPHLGG